MKRGITFWCGTVPLISTTVSSLLLFTEIITDLFWGNLSPDKCCTMFHFGYWSSGTNSPPDLALLCALQGMVQAEPLLLSCSWTAGAVFCPERLSQYHEDRSVKPLRFVICPRSEVLPPSAVKRGWRWVWACRGEVGTAEAGRRDLWWGWAGCKGAGEPAGLMGPVQH